MEQTLRYQRCALCHNEKLETMTVHEPASPKPFAQPFCQRGLPVVVSNPRHQRHPSAVSYLPFWMRETALHAYERQITQKSTFANRPAPLKKWHETVRKRGRVKIGRLILNNLQRSKRYGRTVFHLRFSIFYSTRRLHTPVGKSDQIPLNPTYEREFLS